MTEAFAYRKEDAPSDLRPLIRLTDVDLAFEDSLGRSLPVLSHVNLSINPGEFVAVLGPSGCGKTSLLRIIARLIEPTGGKVSVEPTLLVRRGVEMSMVFQRATLLPWRTVEENILWPCTIARQDLTDDIRQNALKLLDLVHLRGFRHALPNQLSVGMQMRVALARAFVTSPRLILMDEPLSALDELTRAELGLHINRLASQANCSVVFVTHSVSEAALVADRIITMRPRPGRVARELAVPFSRPRTQSLVDTQEFGSFCSLVRSQLKND
jgi:NitT/TauT family transport system ATP-binding protein